MKISLFQADNKQRKMSKFGIGPALASLSILYCLAVFAVSRSFAPLFAMFFIPGQARMVIGLIFLLAGIVFYLVSVLAMLRAYDAERLNTTGVYACCRNPIYAAWIVFIVPGMAFLLNSWLGLTAPFVMYLFMKMLIKKEEQALEEMCGNKYLVYKKNTPELLPIGWLLKNRHGIR